jgi:hypothetical protein
VYRPAGRATCPARGEPIAVIKPLRKPASVDAAIRQLEGAGLLRPATKRGPMPPWKPRPLRGAPLAQTIRDERDAR